VTNLNDRLHNVDFALSEVDVAPPQAEDFAAP